MPSINSINVMRSFIFLFITILLISCASKKNSEKPTIINDSNFKSIYPFALRGELQNVFNILDTINEKKISPRELKIKERYYTRFINQNEIFNYKTSDENIIEFVDMFHSYWKKNMIHGQTIEKADSLFTELMANYLIVNKYIPENVSFDLVENNLYKYSNDFLKGKGYFSNAFGKTGHLYDLFLWKKEEIENYSIELIEESVNVKVHLMDDFISTGWSHYTTFGRSYASGWANREALFCVVSAYDIESENFKISYLTHEGQHFSDYKKYPKLIQKDLEYRAKLVELAKSETTTIQIINKFITNASNQPENAHAFANYCVIRDLSKLLFNKNYVNKKNDWMSIDSQLIKDKSKILFNNNTEKLDSIGNKLVIDFIK